MVRSLVGSVARNAFVYRCEFIDQNILTAKGSGRMRMWQRMALLPAFILASSPSVAKI